MTVSSLSRYFIYSFIFFFKDKYDLNFVKWYIILLKVSIRSLEKGWTWSAMVPGRLEHLNYAQLVLKGSKACQESIPHNITPAAA